MAKTVKVIKNKVEVQGIRIPVVISMEWRRDIRFSVARSAAFLRLPYMMPRKRKIKEWDNFKKWIEEAMRKQPEILDRFRQKDYEDGDELVVGKRRYSIRIRFEERKSHRAEIKNGKIQMVLCNHVSPHHLAKAKKQLISRCVGLDFLPEIKKRVEYWNAKHFGKEIKGVRFKLNKSNWGSCSSKGNINLSTRLLFAPDEVIDYVIVHELAHLVEFNHSPDFWQLVESIIPEYRKYERWLKEESDHCRF